MTIRVYPSRSAYDDIPIATSSFSTNMEVAEEGTTDKAFTRPEIVKNVPRG
jgi:hypothetical protein